MPCTIFLRNNQTGEVREIQEQGSWDEDGSPTEYMWTDGNYGCDCNRLLFWLRAKNEDEPDFEDLECGEGGFSIVSVVENGISVYSETVP